jgi:hypothetical protein
MREIESSRKDSQYLIFNLILFSNSSPLQYRFYIIFNPDREWELAFKINGLLQIIALFSFIP